MYCGKASQLNVSAAREISTWRRTSMRRAIYSTILAYHADCKTLLVLYRRDRLDALLASAGVTDVRPHLVSSCPEPMDLLLLFTPELKRILGIPLTNPPKSWRTFSIASHKFPIFSWSWTFFVGAAPECACPNLRIVPVGLHRNQNDSVRIAKQMRVKGMACALPMHI